MRIGCAKEIITPIKPTKLACAGKFDTDFEHIHDDVFVRCIVLDDGKEMAVLMGADLLFHDCLLGDAVAGYAEERYGIKKSSVTLGYSHSHMAPAARGYNLNHHDDEYEAFLICRAKSCLDRAMCSMFEGEFEYGVFDADFNVSRRGNVNGVFLNRPDFEYPCDREFWVMCAKDTKGKIRSIVTNYACHPVFYPSQNSVSAEFPGRLCQLLDAKYYGCTSVFFQSSGADVRPRTCVDMEALKNGTNEWAWKRGLTFDDVTSFAEDMFSAVTEFIEKGGCKKCELSIASTAFEIELPMDARPPEYFAEQKEIRKNSPDNPERNHAFYIADGGYEKLADTLQLRASVIRLSDNFYIATMGGEPCFGVKKAALKPFGEKDVCFIGYTDACAYIVDDRVLSEGGYEPTCHLEYCLKGPFKPGLDAKYTEAFEKAFGMVSEK